AAALAVGLSPMVVTASSAAPGPGGYDPAVVEPPPAVVATPSPEPVTVIYPGGQTITVERTADLRRSVVRVSWTGFRPTNTPVFSERTLGPITVMQCHTSSPRREFCAIPGRRALASGELPENEPNPEYRRTDGFNRNIPFVQFGPTGTVYEDYTARPDNTLPENTRSGTTITNPDGTTSGQVDFEIRTKRESPSLGCDSVAPCSIVVVPLDLSIDPARPNANSAASSLSVSNWARRAVFPLTFAPDNSICPLGEAETDTFGSELLSDAITQWQPALCQDPIDVTLGFAYQGEDESRRQFGQIVTDTDPANDGRAFAFVSRPVPDLPPTRPVEYAPVAVSAVAVSFLLDDDSGRPIESVKLSPRLLAKLLTQSYDYREFGNPSVADNPPGLYQDEEFLALNPTLVLPFSRDRPQPIQVRADGNDLVWELWRWIGQDADARAWLDGAPDPYGMTVHPLYQGLELPTSSVAKRDTWIVPESGDGEPSVTYGGQQFFDLLYQYPESYATVTANLVIGRSPASLDRGVNDQGGVVFRPVSPAAPGQRGLIAITDLASATRSRFRLAQLPNSTGAYVAPSDASMAAALTTTTAAAGTGLLTVDHEATTAAAYPLTMVSYAVAPTTGVDP
ncbi:MAG: hypothetical protein H7Y15_19610, partial [Pseudonocardia sp.]|nr:hypothetical protein [Pseudonocardia sp.]